MIELHFPKWLIYAALLIDIILVNLSALKDYNSLNVAGINT